STGGAGGTVGLWSGNTAVFSAGTDATSAFTVTVPAATTVTGITGITLEEGTPTFTGAGTIQLNASGATFAQNARPATWGAAIDGATSAGITAILRTGSGAGTWSGNNSYTGRLVIGSGAAVGAGTFNNVNAFGAGGVGNETIC